MKNYALVFILLLFASCAQILSPDGGPKDHTPPAVLKYEPDSAAVNFTGKQIVIRFNEYVQLSDLNNQLIISPALPHQPEVNIRKRSMIIDIKDTLQPNTTYSISFGSAVRDITEGNVPDNFRYVFSTGPSIDSLHISGKLINASTLASESGVSVMLYDTDDDSAPYRRKPFYITKTKADGGFMITNIRPGRYRIFALEDKNQNYFFDPEERIAYIAEPLKIDRNIDTLHMKLFTEGPTKQKRLKADVTRTHIQMIYAMPMKDVQFVPSLDEELQAALNFEKSATGDTIDIWLSNFQRDSLVFSIMDGMNNVDEYTARFPKKVQGSSRGGHTEIKPQLSVNIVKGAKKDPLSPLMIHCSDPINGMDKSRIVLMQGKDTLRTAIDKKGWHDLELQARMLQDSTYTLFILPGAITAWSGKTNDTLKPAFTVENEENYSALKIKPAGLVRGNYLLQLLDEKGSVLRTVKWDGGKELRFEHLYAGQFRLKLTVDSNNNGKWDSGNYLQHKQPEQVIFYNAPIKLRAGWDLDVDWKFQ
jgi:hypothetical protein